MNEQQNKKSCSACKAYLFEDDDVVHCPVCGAPHHRDCWNALGDCALHEYHGTENQYKPYYEEEPEKTEPQSAQTRTCPFCKEEYSIEEKVCPNCQMPPIAHSGVHVISLDMLGGVPADADLGKGVTAEEARKFVLTNTQRYIPKFAKMAAGFKRSWNWFAFLFPGVWMLSRKMYKSGTIVTALSVLFTILTLPLLTAIDTSTATNTAEMFRIMMEEMPSVSMEIQILSMIGAFADLILRIIVGIMGDSMYHKHTINTISRIKRESEDAVLDFEKLGGISLLAMMIGYLAQSYLPTILLMFI